MKTLEELVKDFNNTTGMEADMVFSNLYNKLSALEMKYRKKFFSIEADDVSSLFMETLWKCVTTYDKSTKFITYLINSLNNSFANLLRETKTQKRVANLLKAEVVVFDDADETDPLLLVADEAQEEKTKLWELIESFPENLRDIARDIVNGYSFRGIAKKRGLTKAQTNRQVPEALRQCERMIRD
jgi:RNA polymerase sigma factor (sigma-70 family)